MSGQQPTTKGSYALFERPSTTFKVADDLVEVNGEMIPKWQLSKGMRNQPHNPTATGRVFSVLGRDPNVPTGGVSGFELLDNSNVNQNLGAIYKFLQQHGVDTKNITLGDLETLYGRRMHAIRQATNKNYNVAIPTGNEALPTEWLVLGYDKEGLVGSLLFNGRTRRTPYMSDKV